MVVNKEGDLELYAVHDTPIHTPWSARGDLAMGIGQSYTIVPGFQELEPPPEPWDIPVQQAAPVLPTSPPRSVDRKVSREDHPARGRATALPTFGRGDEDGFPALRGTGSVRGASRSASTHGSSTHQRANLAATRPGRTYSPAALRNMYFEHSSSKRSGSVSPTRVEDRDGRQAKHRTSTRRSKSKDASPAWARSTETTMQHAIEGDISMIMRERVIRGYGLVNVRHMEQ